MTTLLLGLVFGALIVAFMLMAFCLGVMTGEREARRDFIELLGGNRAEAARAERLLRRIRVRRERDR